MTSSKQPLASSQLLVRPWEKENKSQETSRNQSPANFTARMFPIEYQFAAAIELGNPIIYLNAILFISRDFLLFRS